MTASWNIWPQNPPLFYFPWNLLAWFSAQRGAWKCFLRAQGRIKSIERGTSLTVFLLRLKEGGMEVGSALGRETLPVQGLVTRTRSRVVSAHVARGEYRGEISPGWQLSGWIMGEFTVATHSSVLAWRIPWTEEPGELQFMGSQRVGHD